MHVSKPLSPRSLSRTISQAKCCLQSILHRPICTTKRLHSHPTTLPTVLAPSTSKTINSSPFDPSSVNIASHRTQAISRHLTTASSAASSHKMSYSKQPSEFSARRIGAPNTLDYRCYIEKDGQPISPFHDIPLYADERETILNMIVEIPRWTNAKLEVGQILN